MEKSCKMTGCEQQAHAKGLCTRHYHQVQIGLIDLEGKPLRKLGRVPLKFQPATCTIEGCANKVRTRGWCNMHYLRFREGNMTEDGKPTGKQRLFFNKGYRTYMRGYRKVKAPESHPHSDKDGYVLEHRLIMEKHLGRFLEPREIVHHKNGTPSDDRLRNLQLMTQSEHARLHIALRKRDKKGHLQ